MTQSASADNSINSLPAKDKNRVTHPPFIFKTWMQECGLTSRQAAEELSIPQALVTCYLEDVEVAVHHRMACVALLKTIEKTRKETKSATVLELGVQTKEYKDCLADLLVCLNRDKKKNIFWPVADKGVFEKLNPFLLADVHGIRTLSKKIRNEYAENKFQPYETTEDTLITRFYSLEFLPFDDLGRKWRDEEFVQYSLSTNYFQQKKKKLAELAITYLFGNNIDILVDKVFKDE